jgi:hypothetical protein
MTSFYLFYIKSSTKYNYIPIFASVYERRRSDKYIKNFADTLLIHKQIEAIILLLTL